MPGVFGAHGSSAGPSITVGHAFGDLDQLVGVAGAGEPDVDGLRVVPVAVQHDPAGVVESLRQLDPAGRAEHPCLPGAGLRSEANSSAERPPG
jgi:hypothetical protein